MTKYRIQVTETVNHIYEIEANCEDDAIAIYNNFEENQFKELDLDGETVWDTYPWDVEEVTD